MSGYKFKKGDKIVYVNDRYNYIIIKKYSVYTFKKYCIYDKSYIYLEEFVFAAFESDIFLTLSEYRKQKLNKLNEKR